MGCRDGLPQCQASRGLCDRLWLQCHLPACVGTLAGEHRALAGDLSQQHRWPLSVLSGPGLQDLPASLSPRKVMGCHLPESWHPGGAPSPQPLPHPAWSWGGGTKQRVGCREPAYQAGGQVLPWDRRGVGQQEGWGWGDRVAREDGGLCLGSGMAVEAAVSFLGHRADTPQVFFLWV